MRASPSGAGAFIKQEAGLTMQAYFDGKRLILFVLALFWMLGAGGLVPTKAFAQSKGLSGKRYIAAFGNTRLGTFPSPDGKYTAVVTSGEAEVKTLSVYTSTSGGRQASHKSAVLRNIQDINGAVWLPNKPHSLVFAATGIYGKAMLALWNSSTSLHMLHHVKHPDSEWFHLDGVSPNGQVIAYRYAPYDADQFYQRILHMKLPTALARQ